MLDFLSSYYLWIKALHIISFVVWMAGLLYLPRLFVYHATTKPGSETSAYFLTMEHKLLRIIMLPAMLMTFAFGVALLLVPGVIGWSSGWIHLKILLVLALAAMHGLMVSWFREFSIDARDRSQNFFRIVNEIPTVIMVVIVILAVVKPF